MAKCRECGVKVGCGCSLINGLCTACHSKVKAELLKQKPNRINHVSVKNKVLR